MPWLEKIIVKAKEKISKGEEEEEEGSKEEDKENKKEDTYDWGEGKKIILGIFILMSVFFISGMILGGMNNKDKVISDFHKAIIHKNVHQFKKCVVLSNPKVKINEEEIKNFLNCMEKNAFHIKSLIDSLYEQARYGGCNESYTFLLKKQERKWGLFDRYVIEIKPYYITLHTNYKNTILYIDDKEIGKSDKEDFYIKYGPLMPGLYDIKACYKNPYTKIEKKEEVKIFNLYNDKIYKDIMLKGRYVYPYSNMKDAMLYVNGKNTGMRIGQVREFGPISLEQGMKMYVQKQSSKGIMKSKEIEIKEDIDIYLPIEREK